MRTLRTLPLGLGLLAVTAGAAGGQPTAEEAETIAQVAKLGGKAEVDESLPTAARVVARFDRATDATLLAVKKLPRVGALDVADAGKCTEKGFAALKGLPHLRKLAFVRSGLSDLELSAVCDCKQLRALVVGESAVTDVGLAGLKRLKLLEVLDLSGNRAVTDRGMAFVATAERLDELYLNNTGVTDKGLKALKPLEGLRRMSASGTAVTEEAARAFAEEMPNLRSVRR